MAKIPPDEPTLAKQGLL